MASFERGDPVPQNVPATRDIQRPPPKQARNEDVKSVLPDGRIPHKLVHPIQLTLTKPDGENVTLGQLGHETEGFHANVTMNIWERDGWKDEMFIEIIARSTKSVQKTLPKGHPNYDKTEPDKTHDRIETQVLWKYVIGIVMRVPKRMPYPSTLIAASEAHMEWNIHWLNCSGRTKEQPVLDKLRKESLLEYWNVAYKPSDGFFDSSFVNQQTPSGIVMSGLALDHPLRELHSFLIQMINGQCAEQIWGLKFILQNLHPRSETDPDGKHTKKQLEQTDPEGFFRQVKEFWGKQNHQINEPPQNAWFNTDRQRGGSTKVVGRMRSDKLLPPEERPRVQWKYQTFFHDPIDFIMPMGLAIIQEQEHLQRLSRDLKKHKVELRLAKIIQGGDNIYVGALRVDDDFEHRLGEHTAIQIEMMIDGARHGPWAVTLLDTQPFSGMPPLDIPVIVRRPVTRTAEAMEGDEFLDDNRSLELNQDDEEEERADRYPIYRPQAPTSDEPAEVEANQHQQTTTQVAERLYNEAFPFDAVTLTTSGEGLLCGLDAICQSFAAQHPTLPALPKKRTLQALVHSDEYQQRMQRFHGVLGPDTEDSFSADQLVFILDIYVMQQQLAYRLHVGYTFPLTGGRGRAIIHSDMERDQEHIIWIWNTRHHWKGLAPQTQAQGDQADQTPTFIPGIPPHVLDVTGFRATDKQRVAKHFADETKFVEAYATVKIHERQTQQYLWGLSELNPFEITERNPRPKVESVMPTLLGQSMHSLPTKDMFESVPQERLQRALDEVNTEQKEFLSNYLRNIPGNLGVYQGVPGSGKTHMGIVAGEIVVEQNKRILIIGGTNDNADSTALRYRQQFDKHGLQDRKVLRLYMPATESKYATTVSRRHAPQSRHYDPGEQAIDPEASIHDLLNDAILRTMALTNATRDPRFKYFKLSLSYEILNRCNLGNLTDRTEELSATTWTQPAPRAQLSNDPNEPVAAVKDTEPVTTDENRNPQPRVHPLPVSESEAGRNPSPPEKLRTDHGPDTPPPGQGKHYKRNQTRKLQKQQKKKKKQQKKKQQQQQHKEQEPSNQPTAQQTATAQPTTGEESAQVLYPSSFTAYARRLKMPKSEYVLASLLLHRFNTGEWTKAENEQYTQAYNELRSDVLSKSSVVVATPFAACLAFVREYPPDYIFIEEGQYLIPEQLVTILAAYPNTVILMSGDPNQTGGVPIETGPKGKEHNLEARVHGQNALKRELDRGRPSFNFTVNYRSHPALVKMIAALFYQVQPISAGRIKIDPIFTLSHRMPQIFKALGFDVTNDSPIAFCDLNTQHSVIGPTRSSHNPAEACYILNMALHMINLGIPASQILVIVGYQAQLRELRRKIQERRIEDRSHPLTDLNVSTIAKAVGQEAPLVILGFTRSDCAGHMSHRDLLVTALSRPISGLVVVGNLTSLNHATGRGPPDWPTRIYKWANDHSLMYLVDAPAMPEHVERRIDFSQTTEQRYREKKEQFQQQKGKHHQGTSQLAPVEIRA